MWIWKDCWISPEMWILPSLDSMSQDRTLQLVFSEASQVAPFARAAGPDFGSRSIAREESVRTRIVFMRDTLHAPPVVDFAAGSGGTRVPGLLAGLTVGSRRLGVGHVRHEITHVERDRFVVAPANEQP